MRRSRIFSLLNTPEVFISDERKNKKTSTIKKSLIYVPPNYTQCLVPAGDFQKIQYRHPRKTTRMKRCQEKQQGGGGKVNEILHSLAFRKVNQYVRSRSWRSCQEARVQWFFENDPQPTP
jgi:hypothetical protein